MMRSPQSVRRDSRKWLSRIHFLSSAVSADHPQWPILLPAVNRASGMGLHVGYYRTRVYSLVGGPTPHFQPGIYTGMWLLICLSALRSLTQFYPG